MTYATQTWTDWSGAPADAPAESKFTADRGNHMEAGIAAAHDALAGTTTGEPSKLLALDDAGRATAQDAVDDTQLPTLGQVKQEIASGGQVHQVFERTLASQPSVTSTTFADIPDLVLTGLKTGDKLKARVKLKYRGASGGSAGGIQVRFKTNVVAVTNKIVDPSAEGVTPLTGWSASSLTTLSVVTTGGAQDGTHYIKAVISGAAASQQISTPWYTTTPGDPWSAAAQLRRGSATARVVRVDYQFKDAAGTIITGANGPDNTPSTGSWTRGIVDTAHHATYTPWGATPSNAVAVRARYVVLNTAAGDEFHFDAYQLEPSATIPDFGSTGGGGTTALNIDGEWYALATAATSRETGYTKAKSIRTADSSDVTVSAGALGTTEDTILIGDFDDITVGGTALTNQTVSLQFAQLATSGTATQLMSGSATFVLVGQSST